MEITKNGDLKVKAIMENYDFSQFYPTAIFARSSIAYKPDGNSVSADTPRYEAGKFGTGVRVEEGTTNLVYNSDFEVLNAAKQRVFFDDFNRTPTLTFNRDSTNSSKTKTMDFVGKVAGSLTESPHIAKYKSNGASTFDGPSTFNVEASNNFYSKASIQDNQADGAPTSATGYYSQLLFSFDVLTTLKRANLIPQSWDVAALKSNLANLSMSWVGYGVGSNAGVSTNGATVRLWNSIGIGWYGTTATNTATSPSAITTSTAYFGSSIADQIDSSGFLHILAHSTYPSDGTIASTLYTDYIKLDVTVNSPDLATNPETGTVVEPSAVRYVNGRYQNLLTINQSSVETDMTGLNGNTGPNFTLTRDSTTAKFGTASLKGVVTTAGDNFVEIPGPQVNGNYAVYPVTPGKTYTFSSYCRSLDGVAFGKVRIVPITAVGGIVGDLTGNSASSTDWTSRSVLTYTAPSNVTGVLLRFQFSAVGTVWFDGAQWEEGSTATDWRVGGSGKGVLIEEGTVNLLTANQSSIETDTTGLVGAAGSPAVGTVVRDTSIAWEGTASAKVTNTGTGAGDIAVATAGSRTAISANTVYTISGYAKSLSGKLWRISIIWYDSTGAYLSESSSVGVTSVNTWTRLQYTATSPATATTAYMQVVLVSAAVNDVLNADALQLEQKAYATSWILGGSTRNAETLTVPTTGMSPTAGTWEQWVYVNSSAKRQVAGQWNRMFEIKRANNGSGIALYHEPTSAQWSLSARSDSDVWYGIGTPDSATPDGWHLFSVTWSGSTLKLYVDGILKATLTSVVFPTGFGSAYIGADSQMWANTYHDAIRVSNVERTATEVLAYFNATSPLTQLDDKTVFLLNFDGDLDAEATVQAGWGGTLTPSKIRLKGGKLSSFDATATASSEFFHGDAEWTDIDISCKCFGYESMLYTRFIDSSNWVRAGVSGSNFYVQSNVSGSITTLYEASTGVVVGSEQTVRIITTGTTVTAYLDGVQRWTGVVAGIASSGKVALRPYDATKNGVLVATFDDIEVKADAPDKWNAYAFTSVVYGYAAITTGKTSSKALKIVSTVNDTGYSQQAVVTAGQNYTLSAWVKGSGFIYFRDDTNGSTYYGSPAFNYADWTKVSWTTTAPSGCSTLRIYLVTNIKYVGQTGNTAWFDSVQLEQKAYSTSYHRNDSTTSVVTRGSENLKIPMLLSQTQGTVEMWVNPTTAALNATKMSSGSCLLSHTSASSNRWDIWLDKTYSISHYNDAAGRWMYASSPAFLPNTWHHIAITYHNTLGTKLYVDGALVASDATETMIPTLSQYLYIGDYANSNGTYVSDCIIDSVRLSNVARPDTDIIASYNGSKGFSSDRYTLANYRFEGNLISHSDVPMVVKKVNGVETLYLRGSVIQE